MCLDRLVERMGALVRALRTIRLDTNRWLVLTGQHLPKLMVLPSEGMEKAMELAVEEVGGRVILPTVLGAGGPDDVVEQRTALAMILGSACQVVRWHSDSLTAQWCVKRGIAVCASLDATVRRLP